MKKSKLWMDRFGNYVTETKMADKKKSKKKTKRTPKPKRSKVTGRFLKG